MSILSEGINRLEKTLSSEAFAYEVSVSHIVKDHILKSSLAEVVGQKGSKQNLGCEHPDEAMQHWARKVWAFLDELRSVSAKLNRKLRPTRETGGHSREWKIKDETGPYRVMYRQGPEGTPFHTLGLDGIVNGDFTTALCVAWEAPLYKEWWPQFTMPTFKVIESKWLRRIRVGQDLSFVRFKVPWPLAEREVVMSTFEIEYLQEELIIGLLESVPEAAEINERIDGFGSADLPPLSTNVRMDVSGGFVLQRISKNQFFFRTILNLDMKLDFVSPWLINFISRQVAGQGLRLYQKAVSAASEGTGSGKAFDKPLKTGLLYERVKLGLEGKTRANGVITHTGQAS